MNKLFLIQTNPRTYACFHRQEPGIEVYLAHTQITQCFSDTMVGQPSRRVWTCRGGDGRSEEA